MDAELRELIDHSKFHLGAVREVAVRLPAGDEELQAVIAETVAAGDQLGFLLITIAALDGGRRVSAEHLVGGALLAGDPHRFGNLAWKMDGDVADAVLVAMTRALLPQDVAAIMLFVAAAWCVEKRGGELPAGFAAEARRLARQKDLKKETLIYLTAAALKAPDEGFQAVMRQNYPHLLRDDLRPASEVFIKAELTVYAAPAIALVPAAPPKVLAQGRPMRRAVEKMGRNDQCHCGSGRKYKRCCFEKDQERLHLSTEVAGKTEAELRAEPETGLTEPRLRSMALFELARLDPRKIPESLRRPYLRLAADHLLLERVVEFFEARERTKEDDDDWQRTFFFVLREQRKDLAERMVAAFARQEEVGDVPHGIRQLLASDDPAAELQVIDETALAMLRETNPSALLPLACGILFSRHKALGILICRSLVATLPCPAASHALTEILEARDRLNLPPDDPFGDVLEKRLAEDMPDEGRDAATLRAARQRLDAKAAEVRELNARIESQRRELERREKKQATRAQPVAPAAVDEADLREMRIKLARLKTTLNERSTERVTLRRELEKARDDLETLRQSQPAAAPASEEAVDDESALYLPEQSAGNQPVRLLEFPPKFREALEDFPRQVARATLALLGRLAGGEPAAFSGAVALRACPGILRQRIGSDHRLLFRLLSDRVQVVDLINRRDLDRRIKSLRAAE